MPKEILYSERQYARKTSRGLMAVVAITTLTIFFYFMLVTLPPPREIAVFVVLIFLWGFGWGVFNLLLKLETIVTKQGIKISVFPFMYPPFFYKPNRTISAQEIQDVTELYYSLGFLYLKCLSKKRRLPKAYEINVEGYGVIIKFKDNNKRPILLGTAKGNEQQLATAIRKIIGRDKNENI